MQNEPSQPEVFEMSPAQKASAALLTQISNLDSNTPIQIESLGAHEADFQVSFELKDKTRIVLESMKVVYNDPNSDGIVTTVSAHSDNLPDWAADTPFLRLNSSGMSPAWEVKMTLEISDAIMRVVESRPDTPSLEDAVL